MRYGRQLAEQNEAAYGPDLASYLNTLGTIQDKMGEYDNKPECFEEANKNLKEALRIYRLLAQEQPTVYQKEIARVLVNLGLNYFHLGGQKKWQNVLNSWGEALNIYKSLSIKRPQYLVEAAKVSINIAEAYILMGNRTMAMGNLSYGMKILKKYSDTLTARQHYRVGLELSKKLNMNLSDF